MFRNLFENSRALLIAGVMVVVTMLAQQPDPIITAVELRHHEMSFKSNLFVSAPSAIFVDNLVIRDSLYWGIEEIKR